MELAWKRQSALDDMLTRELAQVGKEGRVWEVRDLAHLDRIHQAAGNRVVVLSAYSRSCGCCKRALQHLDIMAQQVRLCLSCALAPDYWPKARDVDV